MSFFDSLKQSISGAAQSMNTELKKYRSKDLMQAIVASATLMAYADGEVSAPEKQKLLGYMRNSEQMSVFEADKVIETFSQCVGRFDFDTTIATGEVLQKLALFKNKPEAQLIARVCLSIANADGQFDESERKAMDKICQALGIDSATVI